VHERVKQVIMGFLGVLNNGIMSYATPNLLYHINLLENVMRYSAVLNVPWHCQSARPITRHTCNCSRLQKSIW